MAEETKLFDPPKDVQAVAHCSSMEQYREMYKTSVEDPVKFWGDIAKEFYWKKEPTPEKFMEYNFDCTKGPISIKFMQDGITNICYNVVDRIIIEKGLGEKIAFHW